MIGLIVDSKFVTLVTKITTITSSVLEVFMVLSYSIIIFHARREPIKFEPR